MTTETNRVKPRVKLAGTDGNAFALMGRVSSALRKSGYTQSEIEQFTTEATSGDYHHLLKVCCQWVDAR